MRFMSVLFTVLTLSTSALAELKYTKSPDAVCNDGNQATFSHFPAKSNKWLVYVQGGGVAINADSYRQRNIHMKTAMSLDHFGDWYPMVRDFSENGYNVIVIPHCSSDMHQGFHSHEIDGKTVKFHGRKIFEDIFSQYDSTFAAADSLVIAGYSAGSIGIGFNADLIAKYDHAFVVADSFWLDPNHLKPDWAGPQALGRKSQNLSTPTCPPIVRPIIGRTAFHPDRILKRWGSSMFFQFGTLVTATIVMATRRWFARQPMLISTFTALGSQLMPGSAMQLGSKAIITVM